MCWKGNDTIAWVGLQISRIGHKKFDALVVQMLQQRLPSTHFDIDPEFGATLFQSRQYAMQAGIDSEKTRTKAQRTAVGIGQITHLFRQIARLGQQFPASLKNLLPRVGDLHGPGVPIKQPQAKVRLQGLDAAAKRRRGQEGALSRARKVQLLCQERQVM